MTRVGTDEIIAERLAPEAQRRLVAEIMTCADAAPFRTPVTPFGMMSVLQTNLGSFGWTADRRGYRYSATDPETGRPWPPLPKMLEALWTRRAPGAPPADSCLVNLYRGRARMGLHRDLDEADLAHPVVSVSLGDEAVFELGGPGRRDPARRLRLRSGDVLVLAGPNRRAYHGISKVLPGTSDLIAGGGRLNLTLRRARP